MRELPASGVSAAAMRGSVGADLIVAVLDGWSRLAGFLSPLDPGRHQPVTAFVVALPLTGRTDDY